MLRLEHLTPAEQDEVVRRLTEHGKSIRDIADNSPPPNARSPAGVRPSTPHNQVSAGVVVLSHPEPAFHAEHARIGIRIGLVISSL